MALSTIPFSALSSDASNQGVNFRNLIINGDMSIAQRGTSITGITTNTYSLDRWTTEGDDCTLTISQSTDVPSGQYFTNSLKMDVTTANSSRDADDFMVISTRFEGQMLQHLKYGSSQAQSVTLSFWCKNTQAGTYMVRILADNGGRHISKSYTVNSANTWEKKTITFEGDTSGTINNDNSRAFRVQWILDAGTTYTSGTLATSWEASTNANRAVGITTGWIDSTSSDFYLTGCQLEVGTSASDFEFLPYDVNLERCERYFERLHREATTTERVSIGWFNTTTNLQAEIHYKEKRTQPSITINNVGNFRVNYLNSATTPSGASGNTIGKKKSTIAWTVSGMTAGQGGGVRTDTTSATIDVDAEL